MQVFFTIVAGVAVFVIGQIIQQFILVPIKDFNKERGDTSYLLLRYQAAITNASNRDTEAIREISEMGASLISTVTQIPFYDTLSSINAFRLPSRTAVNDAAKEINGIVYRMRTDPEGDAAVQNMKALNRIAELLRIRTSYT